MKVVFLLKKFPALSETFILNQITGLINKGHNVDILASSPSEQDTSVHNDVYKYNLLRNTYYNKILSNKWLRVVKGIFIILTNIFIHPIVILKSLNFLKYGRLALSLNLLYFVNLLLNKKNTKYDIIQCHFGFNGLLGIILKDFKLLKGKIIVTFHGSDITSNFYKKKKRNSYNYIFEKSDLCTTNSNFLKKKVIELGCNKNKIIRLPVGVDLDLFRPNGNVKDNIIQVLSIARLVKYKGLEYSIKAFVQIINDYPDKDIIYYIIGGGPEENNLRALIKELDLENNIKLEGWKNRDEIIGYYKLSDIFILPSIAYEDGREEAQGLVLQEAQAMKIPVVATNIGGIPEGVLDGKTGFIVCDKSINDLTEKVSYLIENEKARKMMGEKGREFVKKYFNQKVINDRLEKIYMEFLVTRV